MDVGWMKSAHHSEGAALLLLLPLVYLEFKYLFCPCCISARDERVHSSVSSDAICSSSMFKVFSQCFFTASTDVIDYQSSRFVYKWICVCIYVHVKHWNTIAAMEAVPWNVAAVRRYLGPRGLSSWAGHSPSCHLPALLQVGTQIPWLQDASVGSRINEGYCWLFTLAHTITCTCFWK